MSLVLERVRYELRQLQRKSLLGGDCYSSDLERAISGISYYLERQPMHPSVTAILRFFEYAHLTEKLRDVSAPFCELAVQVAHRAPDNPETTVALRKLLEAKDAAVRAAL